MSCGRWLMVPVSLRVHWAEGGAPCGGQVPHAERVPGKDTVSTGSVAPTRAQWHLDHAHFRTRKQVTLRYGSTVVTGTVRITNISSDFFSTFLAGAKELFKLKTKDHLDEIWISSPKMRCTTAYCTYTSVWSRECCLQLVAMAYRAVREPKDLDRLGRLEELHLLDDERLSSVVFTVMDSFEYRAGLCQRAHLISSATATLFSRLIMRQHFNSMQCVW